MEFLAASAARQRKNVQKCGEITVTLAANKKVYALNCSFCETICLQLEVFAAHMELHAARLYDALELEELENNAESYGQEDESKYDMLNEDFDAPMDPLEEPPLNVESKELSTTEFVVKDEDEYEGCTEEIEFQSNMEAKETGKDDDRLQSELEEDSSDDKAEVKYYRNVAEPDNMELELAIIICYKEESALWDISHPQVRKKRRDALKNVTDAVNKKMQLNLKTDEVGAHIQKLRYKFRRELVIQQNVTSKGEDYKSPWYCEELSFLKPHIRWKYRNKRGYEAVSTEKPALPIPNFTDEQNLKLIEIYKNFPSLWDLTHIDNRFKKKRQQVMEEMLTAVNNEMNLSLTQVDLEKKLYRVRYACTQQKHRQLQCQQQQETFHPTCKYINEISFLEDHVGPFKCEYCAEIFNGHDQYKIHKHKHDGSMPFTCPICNRGFMCAGNCTVHLRRHTRDFPYKCEICGKGCATSSEAAVHMRKHTGEKPYFCELCGQSFRTCTFFNTHMRRHQKRPDHKCSICSKAFYETNQLNEHMKAHLNVRDKVCNVCGKAFTTAKSLRQHKQIHAEKKKYVCKICGKNFAQYAGLSGHVKSHGTTITGGMLPEEKT